MFARHRFPSTSIRSVLLLALMALIVAGPLVPTRASAQGFEGKVTWGFEGPGPGMDLTYYMKGGDKMRVDMGENGYMVINGESRIMVLPAQRMWMDLGEMEAMASRMGMSSMAEQQEERDMPVQDLVETGETGNFAGIDCTYYRVTEEDATTEMCAATDLGWFTGVTPGGNVGGPGGRGGMGAMGMSGPPGMSPEQLQEWQDRFPNGFFPLEITRTENGTQAMRMFARELSQESLGDDLFPTEGPEGYQKMSMGGIG